MRESISINGRDLTDAIPDSGNYEYNPAPTSRRGKVAQFDLDDDYDIDNQL